VSVGTQRLETPEEDWRQRLRSRLRDRDPAIYGLLLLGALAWPAVTIFASGSTFLVSQAADAGVWVLLAIGLNVVVGFAGLLDLGYAAFFAIGAYSYALLASDQLGASPLHHSVHLPFWLLLFVGMFVAAAFGAILGAPTLRLRGDYLAIVTLGFGEIVPRVFRNLPQWTGGINAVGNIDQPVLPVWLNGPWAGLQLGVVTNYAFNFDPIAYYVLIVLLVVLSVLIVNNLYRSRMGRAWMAIREDEVAASAMGINTVSTKLLAFAIGAAFSGFAGAYFGAKLSLVGPDNFEFVVSITVLVMVVLGGMGSIPGVMLGALVVYAVLYKLLPDLPNQAVAIANGVGLGFLNERHGDWAGLGDETQRLNYLFFGLILVLVMLLRPQGLVPSRVREQELTHEKEAAAEVTV
jgi:ABC-type branched-subunit amino acid transport system permease subunit